MKNERKIRLLSRPLYIGVFLCLFCAFFQLSSSAQSAGNGSSIDTYVSQHRSSPLVRYYLANPGNFEAANAIKSTIVLDNPDHANMGAENIARMQAQIDWVKDLAKKAEEMEQQGIPYDRAVSTIQARVATDRANARPEKASDSTTPTLSVPGQ